MSDSEPGTAKTAAVIGAGIAGVSTAMYLQRDGHAVTVFDPERPGSMTSYGNAGPDRDILDVADSDTRHLMKVPKMLMDQAGPLSLRWTYLPQLTPQGALACRNSAPDRIRRNALVKSLLLNRAWDDFRPLVEAAKAEDLIYAGGMLRVFRTDQAFEGMKPLRELDLMDYTKRSYELLNADEIRQMEPALEPIFPHAIYSTDSRNIRNPGRLTEVFADHFVAKRGTIDANAVTDIARTSDGKWRVKTDRAENLFDVVVVAAGSWSRRLAKKLGIRLLLESERGYHVMILTPEQGLNRSVLFGEEGFMMSPMESDIVSRWALSWRASMRRRTIGGFGAVGAAEGFVKGLKVKEESIWMGRRPSTPDTVPILGGVSRMDGLYFATGGAHIGMSLGPTFGKIIADLVAGRDPGIDLEPYRPDRW